MHLPLSTFGRLLEMKTTIRSLAKKHGFDDCRFAKAVQAPHANEYFSWLQTGNHGDMTWLSRDPERRADPARVLVDAKTVLVLATNYFQGTNPRRQKGKIARYAWGADYHQIMLQNMVPIDGFPPGKWRTPKVLRRHRANPGARLCGHGWSLLARQEHHVPERASRNLVFHRRHLDDPRI